METEGLLGSFDVLEAFVHLWSSKFTGALRFERESLIKIFYFHDGVVVAATSNDLPDQIGEILKKNRKLTAEQLAQVQETSTVRSLGEGLVTAGFISRKELLWALKMQLIEMIASILRWSDGSYSLVENYLPKRTESVSFLTQHVLLELILRTTDRQLVVPRLLDPSEVLHKLPERLDDYKALDLSKDADAIVSRLDGQMTAGELAASSQVDDFSVYKLLGALKLLGMIGGDSAAAGAPSLEEALVAPSEIDFGTPAISFDAPAPEEPGLGAGPVPSVAFEPAIEMPVAAPGIEPEAEPEPESVAPPKPRAVQMELELPRPASPSAPAAGFTFDEKPEEAEEQASSLPASAISDETPPADFGRPAPVPSFSLPREAVDTDKEPTLEAQLGETFEEMDVSEVPPSRTGRIQGKRLDIDLTPRGTGWRDAARQERSKRFAIWGTIALGVLVLGAAVLWHLVRSRSQAASNTPPPLAGSAAKRPRPATSVAPAATAAASATPAVASATAAPKPETAAAVARTAAVVPPATAKPAPVPTVVASAAPTKPSPVASAAPRPVPPPTPTPVAPSSGSKYETMARDFAARAAKQPATSWTIKLDSVCADESVQRALDSGTADFQVWFIPVSVQGKTCFRIFGGFYPTEAAAKGALEKVPARFREGGARPVVQQLEKALR